MSTVMCKSTDLTFIPPISYTGNIWLKYVTFQLTVPVIVEQLLYHYNLLGF